MKKKIPAVIILILAVAAICIYKYRISTSGQYSGSGTIEVTEVDIGPRISGKIEKISVEEGAPVKTGALLAVIAHDELDAQMTQAQAAQSSARTQVSQIETQLANAGTNLNRAKSLFSAGAVTRQNLDDRQAQYDVLSAQLTSAKMVDAQAGAQVAYIQSQLNNAYLVCPIDGVVLKRNAEPGEIASAGMSIVTIGDIARPWLKIYLSGTQLGAVKLNSPAKVSVDAFPGRVFEGRVSYISEQAEFTPKNVQTKDERTRLVYAVKIAMDNPAGELKPGMTADAVINASSR